MDYRHKKHCKYSLKAHLIFVIKYRKKLLYGKVNEDMKQYLYEISNRYDYNIITMESDKDHIHILLEYPATESISKIVKLFKQITTNMVWKDHGKKLQSEFWVEHTFWSDGYFASSIGDVSQKTIEKYIESQG